MRKRFFAGWGLVIALVVTMLSVPGGSVLAAQNGLDVDGYESLQFGYTITWEDDWEARARDVISNPGGYDTLTLRSDDGTLWVQGQGDQTTAEDAVVQRIGIEGSEDDLVASDLDADVPVAEMLVGRDKVLIEGYTLEGNGAVVVIVLSAPERDFDDALASVQEQILFNDDQVLTGIEPQEGIGEDEPSGIVPEDADEDPTRDANDSAVVDLTEEPTGEATGVPEEEVDDEATEEPAGEATAEVVEDPAENDSGAVADQEESVPGSAGSGIDGSTYTSPLYNYSFEWDEETWDVTDEILADRSDGLQLVSGTGALTIWSWDAYDDPASCLDGESAHYGTGDPAVDDWEPALDVDGEPIRAEADDYAWGVFTLTYIDEEHPDAEPVELVDYLECRTIPATDSMLIILGSATPDQYNDHLDHVLDVGDTITFVNNTTPNVTEPESDPVEPGADETGLDGSLFTSPSFGFTVDIPVQWRIVDEMIATDNERLALSNGTSDVTIRATDAYADDLAGCVDFAADESAYDLELDDNANGQPFRGDDRNGAYGNFIYEDEVGGRQAYFISCQYIEDDASVLILTQDLAYEDISNERKFRSELQDAILLP